VSDFSRLNIRGLLKKNTVKGPDGADDTSLISTGTVLDVNPDKGMVRIAVRGGDVWLPANADRYASGVLARVLLDPTNARPVLVAGAVTPSKPAVLATIASGPTGGILTVTLNGISYAVPAPMGAYTIGQTAWILTDEWGIPQIAIGPSSTATAGAGVAPPAPAAPTVTATTTIGAQTSGTYRTGSGWDRWNTGKYGGPSDVYQGAAYGSSGTLIGFAGFGDQVVNLGALSIDDISVPVKKTSLDGFSAALTVQGSASGSRPGGAPSGSGDTAATGVLPPGGWGSLQFTPNMREAFRTGAARGLVAVGSAYGGFGGTATPGSLVLQIRYTKNDV
jgi:hypothetical protein